MTVEGSPILPAMNQAQKAVAEFQKSGSIPNMGQRIYEGVGPGAAHVFPDGSIACHWDDGAFLVSLFIG